MLSKKIKTVITAIFLFIIAVYPAKELRAEIFTGTAGGNISYKVDTEAKITTVNGEGVTEIEYISSVSAKYMESIELPSSLKAIHEGAFAGCRRLIHIEIPENVETIGKTAFQDCEWLKTVINHSGATIFLPSHPDFSDGRKYSREIPYEYYVDGKLAITVPPGKTAIGKARKYKVNLENEGGTLSKYESRGYTYYRFGEPLKLPTVKWKGRIFCGWTAKAHSNYAWRTITNQDTENPYGTTRCWTGEKTVYAQFAKVEMKKVGRTKLKVNLSKWRDGNRLEIQYTTNKKYKNTKRIIVKSKELEDIVFGKKNKKKNYRLKYYPKKRMLSITLNKLKAKKRYYFRFQFSGNEPLNADENYDVTGDWFKKSVKM